MNLCGCDCGRYTNQGKQFIKGHNLRVLEKPWNKNLTKEIDERVAQCAQKLRTRVLSPSQFCACNECGLHTKPGNKYINGHNHRGILRIPVKILYQFLEPLWP